MNDDGIKIPLGRVLRIGQFYKASVLNPPVHSSWVMAKRSRIEPARTLILGDGKRSRINSAQIGTKRAVKKN